MSEHAFMPGQFVYGEGGQTSFLRRGRGEVVVLIHGVGMAASIWEPQLVELSKKYSVVAYDLLGHGGSSLPSELPELAEYASQLLSLLDALNLDSVHVVGHSMGALVALEFALEYPGRVISVTALNAVYCRTPEHRSAIEQRVADFEVGSGLGGWEGTLARWFDDQFKAKFPERVNQVRMLLSTVDFVGYTRAYKLFARSDRVHLGRLANLKVPSLFMTGEYDQNSNPAMSQAMAGEVCDGKVEIIKGERHMMSVTAPDEVNRRLLGFLDFASSPKALTGAVEAMAFDQKGFRSALGSFMTGVTVVSTAQSDGEPRGFTANSFNSVSLDPPLVLVSIAKTAASYSVFTSAKHFSVSVLSENQRDVSGLFASKATDKFAKTAWRKGPTGSPLIDGAVAWFDCRAHNVVIAGDHAILIGEVVAFESSMTSPLGYCQGAYVTLGLSQKAIAGSGPRTCVGAILEQDGSIVLVKTPDGSLDLPTGVRLEPKSDPTTLLGTLSRLGLNAELGFLFAVFEDAEQEEGSIFVYYRGVVQRPEHLVEDVYLVPMHEIPWKQIRNNAIRSMLERYVRERTEDSFGIYVGNAQHGIIEAVMPRTVIQSTSQGLLK
jgi:flavin reductase (DIM6/NTAB) family NADH-FMN oxidoreductase RutF/pimeloyl-ACP methyl ester carboxylesterase